jgi:hypothetical protein
VDLVHAPALFAQAVAEQPLAGILWQAAIGILGTVLTAVLAVTGRAIQTASVNSRFAGLINQLWTLVQATVSHAEVELRPVLAKAMADGTLDPAEAAELKATVLASLRKDGATQLQALAKSFGLSEDASATLLSGLVERAVLLLKTSPAPSPVAAVPAPVPVVAP